MKAAVVVFPGSNCDRDCERACRDLMGWHVTRSWHRDQLPHGLDLVILPGGFSHGDYLRCGALAALAPIMDDVKRFANAGGLVLGICNGFQILCESGLLPGVLQPNRDLEFHCETVFLKATNRSTPFSTACPEILRLPIAHRDGNYFASKAELDRLEGEGRIVFQYSDAHGNVTPHASPNGAARNIAGIVNDRGNVCGMMPHPERHGGAILGGEDGLSIFRSIESFLPIGAVR